MKLKLVAVFASVLLIATGAAVAMPGSAPDHAQDGNAQADDHAQDDADAADAAEAAKNESSADADDEDAEESAAGNDSEASGNDTDRRGPPGDVPGAGAADAADSSQGPPVDMPEQVPDFVSGIHETIGNVAGGAVDGAQSLGERISALTSGGSDAGDAPTDEAGNATATPAP